MCTYTRPSCKLACIVRPVSAAVSNNSDHSGPGSRDARNRAWYCEPRRAKRGTIPLGFGAWSQWCSCSPPWHAIARLLVMASSRIILMVALLSAQSGTCSLLSDGVGGSLSERPGVFDQVFLQEPDLRLGYIEIPQSDLGVYPVRQGEIQAALIKRMAGF
jgi:hypothetical protein